MSGLLASPYLAALVGDLHTVVAEYLQGIHWWVPIISKSRLSNSLETVSYMVGNRAASSSSSNESASFWNPSIQQSTDSKDGRILNGAPCHQRGSTSWRHVLSLASSPTSSWPFSKLAMRSIRRLISPLVRCARYGAALGADASLRPDFEEDNPLMERLEVEERRRAWWMVLILTGKMEIIFALAPLVASCWQA